MKGCEAIAEAAVRAGCRFFAGYPITPQNEIPEYFSRRMPEVGGVFVQGESEVASVNMVYGAASMGTRSMTSSSSPGIALKSEGISYCASARIPMVYANISRGGPGVGSIQPAQMDYFQATKASGNGGFQMLVFAPSSVQEAVDMTYAAFDYADRDRNPVLILADGVIGTMMEPVVLPEMKSDEEVAAIKASKQSWACVGHKLDYAVSGPQEAADILNAKWGMGLKGGVLIANPIPEEYGLDFDKMEGVIQQALSAADEAGVHGKDITPFLLAKVKDLTGGESLASNIQLALNNAQVAAQIAAAM